MSPPISKATSTTTSTASAPVEIDHIALTVHDLAAMTAYYEGLLGLHRLSSDGSTIRLGAGNDVLLELRGDKTARRHSRQEAGLFHTAFLMPHRAALGAWLIHAADQKQPLDGASDHLVSEAIYLSDPEGNGIEVYADRPRLGWYNPDGSLKMGTEALDLNAVAHAAKAPFAGAPQGLVIGHVHLQVGNLAEALRFYHGVIGMPVTTQMPTAAFYGAGGYHHHLATNVWNSRNAKARSFPATGLAELTLRADAPDYAAIVERGGSDRLSDPWGTPVTVVRKA